MKFGYGLKIAGSICLLTIIVGTSGCGYKSDPVPPQSVVPVPIEDLRYSIDDSGVRLTWSYPIKTIKGTDIVDVSAFDIYRAVVPLDNYCKTCPIPFGEPVEVPGGVTSETGKRRMAEYRTSLLRSGHKYFFKVRSKTSWWADSGDSNIVSFVWHKPTTAPEMVSAVADDSKIELKWDAVTTLIDNSPVDGKVSYQVMRSEGGKGFSPVGDPVTDTRFVDRKVVNGRKYFYKVQSQLVYKGHIVDGGMSEIVNATPVDKTPPPPPTGLRAVQTGAGIKIFWDPAEDSHVAGFRIYRRAKNEKTPKLIGEVKSIYTLFEDKDAPDNIRVYYSITAIDKADPPNESDYSREATIR